MRVLAILGLTIFIGLRSASAATVDLSDGRVVQGDIVKQDDKSVQINVDGVTMTYYADEIKDVDGKPFASSPEKPASDAPAVAAPAAVVPPAPVVQPQAAAPIAPVTQSADTTATSTVDAEKRALILKFIDVFGTRQALNNNFETMIKQIEKQKPDEAVKIRQRIKVDEIIERLIPIYDRNFTSEDLKAFIAFYESDAGKKLISTVPEMMKESVQESIKYMKEKFPEAS